MGGRAMASSGRNAYTILLMSFKRDRASQLVCGWVVSMPASLSMAKEEASPNHQRAWFESRATSWFLYFIKGLPSANDSSSEEMAPNQEAGYMADGAVQLQLNGYTLTGSGNFHNLSSKSWRGFFMEAESPSGGIDRWGNSRWSQSWHASHLQLP